MVLNVETGERLESIYSAEESARAMSREGQVAAAAFKHLRGDATLTDDIPELVAARPFLQLEGAVETRVRLLFTAWASFAASDRVWSSYTVAEEVLGAGLPERIAKYSRIPLGVHDALRSGRGTPIGVSELPRTHRDFKRLDAILNA
jgi:hypothetical protein